MSTKTKTFEECKEQIGKKYKLKLPANEQVVFQTNGWVNEAVELYASEKIKRAIELARSFHPDFGHKTRNPKYTEQEILELLNQNK